MRDIKTVLVIFNSDNDTLRQECNGICRYADKMRWHVEPLLSRDLAGGLAKAIDFWKPVGILVDATIPSCITDRLRVRVPVVSLDDNTPPGTRPRFPSVSLDNKACARLAFDELASCGVPAFAFLHYASPAPVWSRNREEEYSKLVRASGRPYFVHAPPPAHPDRIRYLGSISDWLKGLPRPLGLFAANDVTAADALIAASRIGLSVPSELSVIGVDDDINICPKTHPPLSSVRQDPDERGFQAARMLAQAIRRAPFRRKIVYLPSGVTRRDSTHVGPRKDRIVDAACALIAAKACAGLTAREVIAGFPCSRSLAQRRFREATGLSVLGAIQKRRIERACELLSRRQQDLSAVANMCGYETPNALRKVFKKATGFSLCAWQKAHRR